ncbi:hypothetical protein GAGA_4365 [Paraglaciecola agarilytica NO2]|uniref:Uncharacterized protein n=1 Tax=Paraglaciecola agarilytica NO2 TaxID=1125747 RepID=A0ABQ0ICS3_9ALTE|nr:hypothetical protein GAGA_4365 [Paraglaciecola agarilytica NO2]
MLVQLENSEAFCKPPSRTQKAQCFHCALLCLYRRFALIKRAK